MRIAIVGSRDWPQRREDEIQAFVRGLPRGTIIVSGGARGVDFMASMSARTYGMPIVEFLPDYQAHGRRAPLVRNALIVEHADKIVAFWDGKSAGTMHVVGLAKKAGRPVEVRR